MKSHVNKTPGTTIQTVSEGMSKQQSTESKPLPLTDNRPGSVVQKKQLEALSGTKNSEVLVQKKENDTGLPNNLKSGIEQLSGYSMNDVKVHFNSSQPAQLSAQAYAQGSNIHLAPGKEQHLPHEAWHVVQQKQGRVSPTIQQQGVAINDSSSLEKEADIMGGKALSINPAHTGSLPAKTTTSSTVQGKFVRSRNKPIAIPDDVLDYVGALLREHKDAYVMFVRLRRGKALHSLYKFLTEQKDISTELREILLGLADQTSDEEEERTKVEMIEDKHYDIPSTSSWTPTFFKYLGEKKGEFWSWLTDGNRVKMQQTAGNIRGSASKTDYKAIRVPLGKIKLLHKIDGDAQKKTDIRAKQVQKELGEMLSRVANKNRKKKSTQKQETIPDALFTFALQKKLFGEANIKVAIDKENNIISLDGVGRIAAIQKALAALKWDPNRFKIDVLALYVNPQEYAELHEIHTAYYDEHGKQRPSEIKKYNYGFGRTLVGPVTKMYGKLHGKLTGSVPERDLTKFKVNDRRVFMMNNCLINAITDAAGLPRANDFQIIQIRSAINQPVGEMLYATGQAIQQIRNVLNIHQPIDVVYNNLIGTGYDTETFHGAGAVLTIQHNGYDHFFFDNNAPVGKKKKKTGSIGFHLQSNLDTLNTKTPELAIELKKAIESFNKNVMSKISGNEMKLLTWLYNSLSTTDFNKICQGGQIRIKFSDTIFKKLISMKAEARKSSHYRGIIIPTSFSQIPNQHYGIDGKFFPTILFGTVKDKEGQEYIYIQAERNSYNPSAGPMEKLHHVFDASKYASEKRNQGPYGESEHTDANPLGGTSNPSPGYGDLLHPNRLQSIPLILLHHLKGSTEAALKNWQIIVLTLLLNQYTRFPFSPK